MIVTLLYCPTIQLTALAERAHEFKDFGEAEQFLFQVTDYNFTNSKSFYFFPQLAKVDRYQDRLMVMSYIGQFDELLASVQPVCVM